MPRFRSALLACLLVSTPLVGSGSTAAQEVRKTVQGRAGEDIQAAVFGSPRPDCTVGPRPEVRVVAPPNHGTLRLGPRTLRTSRIRNCPVLEVPVIAVFYKARPSYAGTDAFRLEVKPHQGGPQTHAITVEVGPRP
jgi:hypothetical protein